MEEDDVPPQETAGEVFGLHSLAGQGTGGREEERFAGGLQSPGRVWGVGRLLKEYQGNRHSLKGGWWVLGVLGCVAGGVGPGADPLPV